MEPARNLGEATEQQTQFNCETTAKQKGGDEKVGIWKGVAPIPAIAPCGSRETMLSV